MKTRVCVLTVLAVVLATAACGAAPPAEPAATAGGDPGFNLLVVADGEVELQRREWSDYHRTAFGAVLHRGDMLRPASGANAVVLCDDVNTWIVPPGMPSGLSNGCPSPQEPVLVRRESELASTRGGTDPSIPFIISPRKTELLDDRPLLSWNELTGVSSYLVQVKNTDTGEIIWQTTSAGHELPYPGQPALESGVTYLLIIEAEGGGSSQDEAVPGLGFRVLEETDAQAVRAATEQIEGLSLNGEAKALALAQIYIPHELIAEAIQLLEPLADAGSQSAAIHRTLGDLYRHTGLSLHAQEEYTRAVELAEADQDVEGEAAAQAALGEVYAALGDADEAVSCLEKAQSGYEALGDTQRASELGERMADLGN
jgi:hypothetical protein